MNFLIEIGLFNALVATFLASIALIVGWWFRRPALTHVLWVVVIVKLVTFPVWRIPLVETKAISNPISEIARIVEAVDQAQAVAAEQPDLTQQLESVSVNKDVVIPRPRPKTLPSQTATNGIAGQSWLGWIISKSRQPVVWKRIGTGLVWIWVSVSALWFAVQAVRCVLFAHYLRRGRAASADLQEQYRQLAARTGVTAPPELRLLPGTVSPMLWGGFRAILIFPEQLLGRLDFAARETLLAHELGHYQRRDHWVRIITLFATGLFWWHPVVWVARRRIESAEEECCDAWVISKGAPPRRYADAILETIDFLAERAWPTPALGTGLGEFPLLRQRLIWIMRGPRPQDLSRIGAALCLCLAAALPFNPTFVAARNVMPTRTLTGPSLPPLEPLPMEVGIPLNVADPHSQAAVADEAVEKEMEPENIDTQTATVDPTYRHRNDPAINSRNRQYTIYLGALFQTLVDWDADRSRDLSACQVLTATFSPDNTFVVTGGRDGIARMWDAALGIELASWQVDSDAVTSIDVSSDGRWVAAGGREGIVHIRSVTGQLISHNLPREADGIRCVRFSDVSGLLAVATGDESHPTGGRIVVWDVKRRAEVSSMNWNFANAAVEFSADGKSLFSGDLQGRVARWDVETGELQGFVNGHQSVVKNAMISRDLSRLGSIAVPNLPVSLLVGDARQDERLVLSVQKLTQQMMNSPLVPRFGPKPRQSNSPASIESPMEMLDQK